MHDPPIIRIDLHDPSGCRGAWRLQRGACEVEAGLVGSRRTQALNESEADLAGDTAEAFEGFSLEIIALASLPFERLVLELARPKLERVRTAGG